MATVANVLSKLEAKAKPKNVEGMAKFGMSVESRLGVSVPEMRKIAKEVGHNHPLALALWKTGIAEAQIVAALIDDPAAVSSAQMDRWVKDFDSWDVCDQACLSLFDKSPLAWQKIPEWAEREEEFVKRAAFALIAGLAWHDKQAVDQTFVDLFPILMKGADDDRNFVKKAVSWAIRNIGKRNPKLNRAAVKLAKDIQRMDSKAARWVAADAIRELQSEAVQRRLNA
jgi:3-methyladenine DNA glycosylase AlkD